MTVTRWGIKISDGPRGSVGVQMDVFPNGKYVLLSDYKHDVAEARSSALRDAVEAVKAADNCTCDVDWEFPPNEHQAWCVKPLTVAAIEALGGER